MINPKLICAFCWFVLSWYMFVCSGLPIICTSFVQVFADQIYSLMQVLQIITCILNPNYHNNFSTHFITKFFFQFFLFRYLEIHNSRHLPCGSNYYSSLIIGNNFKFPFITLEKTDCLINYARSALSYGLYFL